MIADILTPLISPRFQNEERYRQGHIRIINALPKRKILGLHIPEMKAVAKHIACRSDAKDVIARLEQEHKKDRFSLCYEETVVWGLAINYMKCSAEERWDMLRRFVPTIDNWGVCDTFCCNTKWVKRIAPEDLWLFLQPYFDSDKEFEVRFAVVMSMCHLLEAEWLPHIFTRLEQIDFVRIHSEYISAKEARERGITKGVALGTPPYYARMAVAWLLATALAKHQEATRAFVRTSTLPDDVKRLYLRKARESLRTRNVAAL